jgi:hypothetical protein
MRQGWPAATVTTVWLVLLAASAASLWLGAEGSHPNDPGHTAMMVGVLAIAFAKIWLIVRYFMEVRVGPLWLRAVLNVWIVGVFAAITVLYLVSGSPHGT